MKPEGTKQVAAAGRRPDPSRWSIDLPRRFRNIAQYTVTYRRNLTSQTDELSCEGEFSPLCSATDVGTARDDRLSLTPRRRKQWQSSAKHNKGSL
ncbi:hypothetical protein EVAR_12303_1 [Eumeta japonica]|uniref:Uncharacterized protein n=1 Tax=Eumeta variegata TaxID=151549 RepID=A0A4C1TUZ7_EUMVA|nr:hypothetical protein EVAR_12303_1 [Eumeta japonica]